MIKKRSTIIDVAKQAGVSKSTVSLVLQNNTSVKLETKQRVMDAIEKTNYVYNRNAAKLRTKNTGLIGFIINDITNAYYAEVSSSIQSTFSQRGYATVLGSSGRSKKVQNQLINSMIEHGVSALVIAPVHGSQPQDFDFLEKSNIPILQIFRRTSEATELPFYSMDYEQGSYLATQHLQKKGAKHIAFVGGMKKRSITSEKVSGYQKALSEKNQTERVFYGTINRQFGYELALDIANNHKKVDGIVAFNDTVALGMLSGFAKAGVSIGKDILMIGFDDIDDASFCYPKLSSVRCKIPNIGQHIAHDLLDWLEKKNKIKSHCRYPVELVIRASSSQESDNE